MTPVTAEKKTAKIRLSVDYPRQGETITWPQYTFRISAPEGVKSVEVAIDQGDWQPCRHDNGYWWRDWSGYDSGEHELITRVETPEGRRIASEPHEFFVKL